MSKPKFTPELCEEMYRVLVSVCMDCAMCNGKVKNAPKCPVARVLAKAREESEVTE